MSTKFGVDVGRMIIKGYVSVLSILIYILIVFESGRSHRSDHPCEEEWYENDKGGCFYHRHGVAFLVVPWQDSRQEVEETSESDREIMFKFFLSLQEPK